MWVCRTCSGPFVAHNVDCGAATAISAYWGYSGPETLALSILKLCRFSPAGIQGYRCNKQVSAQKDLARSKPDEAVWVLRCENGIYRVPDMAARVQLLK